MAGLALPRRVPGPEEVHQRRGWAADGGLMGLLHQGVSPQGHLAAMQGTASQTHLLKELIKQYPIKWNDRILGDDIMT